MNVATQIEQLEKSESTQRVQKRQERRHFMERLQAYQRDYEKQLGELEQRSRCSILMSLSAVRSPLDEHHWNR